MEQWEVQQAVEQQRQAEAQQRAEVERATRFQIDQDRLAHERSEQGQSSRPGYASDSGEAAAPVGKPCPFWLSLLLWGGWIWAITHFSYMTQGSWSGPFLFGSLAMVLLITAPSLRSLTLGCLVPFTVFGTLVVIFVAPHLTAPLRGMRHGHAVRAHLKMPNHRHHPVVSRFKQKEN